MTLLESKTIYVAFDSTRLLVRDLAAHGVTVDISPVVALVNDVVVAMGVEAESIAGARIVRPFQHPRLAFHEFEAASALLVHCVRQIEKILRKPRFVLHPLAWAPGELTDIELRSLIELARSVGGRSVAFHYGAELRSPDELSVREALRWF